MLDGSDKGGASKSLRGANKKLSAGFFDHTLQAWEQLKGAQNESNHCTGVDPVKTASDDVT